VDPMKAKKALIFFILFSLLIGSGVIVWQFYSYIFAKTIVGEITGVERVTQPTTIIGNNTPAQIYSFAVAVRTPEGEIHTASTEDRQWAVVQKGQCGEAKFFPYPPWNIEKSGTYFGARLIRLFDCPKK
jgi:hypothetical protein